MADFPPHPDRRGVPPVLAGALGALVGAMIMGGGFTLVMIRQQHRHEAELAALGVNAANVDAVKQFALGAGGAGHGGPADSEEKQALKFGTEFVGDLEANRLASAYRSMTAEYQQKTDRKMFDALIGEYPQLQSLWGSSRPEKVRKAGDGKWEYYITCQEKNRPEPMNKVNVSLLMVREGETWKVAELEISADSKMK